MKNRSAKTMALGGVFAALAVVIMCMGTLIPVATFACPMICMLMLQLVLKMTDQRTGWAWYGAVALLGLLLAPDKEAAAVFLFLGYYPIVKPHLENLPVPMIWKLGLFNGMILLMYWALMNLFGMTEISDEYAEMGVALTLVLLALGNVTFWLLDRILSGKVWRRSRG